MLFKHLALLFLVILTSISGAQLFKCTVEVTVPAMQAGTRDKVLSEMSSVHASAESGDQLDDVVNRRLKGFTAESSVIFGEGADGHIFWSQLVPNFSSGLINIKWIEVNDNLTAEHIDGARSLVIEPGARFSYKVPGVEKLLLKDFKALSAIFQDVRSNPDKYEKGLEAFETLEACEEALCCFMVKGDSKALRSKYEVKNGNKLMISRYNLRDVIVQKEVWRNFQEINGECSIFDLLPSQNVGVRDYRLGFTTPRSYPWKGSVPAIEKLRKTNSTAGDRLKVSPTFTLAIITFIVLIIAGVIGLFVKRRNR